MKTPWSNLLQHGTAYATILVLAIAGVLLLATVAVVVILTKLSVLVR